MRELNAPRLTTMLAFLWLVASIFAGNAWAQSSPATLRLVQVVPRIPTVNLYALAQAENGEPTPMNAGDLKALVGPETVSVTEAPKPEGIAIVFLIDVSGSMRQGLDALKPAIQQWIGSLVPRIPLAQSDWAAIVTLGSRVTTVADFTPARDSQDLKGKIARLSATEPNTLLYQGMVQAVDLARRVDPNLPLRRAIVVLTDGQDDQQGGAGRQQVEDALSLDPIPIYALGAANGQQDVDKALKDFSALVYRSGGAYVRVDVTPRRAIPPDQRIKTLQGFISSTQHFTAKCETCKPDGSRLAAWLRVIRGTVEVNSGTVTVLSVGEGGKIIKTPPPPPPAPPVVQPPPPVHVAQNDQPAPPKDIPPPPEVPPPPPWWRIILNTTINLPWKWLAPAAVALLGAIAGLIAIFVRKSSPPPDTTRVYTPPVPTQPEPDSGGLTVQDPIPPGTQLQLQRLRITPIGHNDLPAQEREFTEELGVGRSQENQIVVHNDAQVSGRHCTLTPKDGLILVRDQGSRNGTRVNGVPIEGFMHAEPDSIVGVGRTELRMQLLAPGQK
jgi:Mg-chelatase subunit ChlD